MIVMAEPTVVIVGSGVAGAATAFALARAKADVIVIDGGRVGQATAAGAGILEPWSTSAQGPVYELYAAGAVYYPRLLSALAESGVTDIGYRAAGSIVVAADASDLDAVEARVRERTQGVAVAGEIDRIGAERARGLFPPLAPGLQAVRITGGARVDGRRLRDGLLTAAERLGAVIRAGDARVAVDDQGSCTVRVDERTVRADAVLVAAGAWTNEVLAPLAYELPVQPQRGQLVHLRLEGVDTSAWPTVLPLADNYIVPFEDGRIVVGATRETGSGFDPRVTAAGLREVLDSALRIAPGLAAATVLETRVGLRPFTTDTPCIGAVAGVPGLFVNAGFGAAGLTMAPAAGAALAELILGGKPTFDLAAFAPPSVG
jgi:D-amino-acid dehydrogenase